MTKSEACIIEYKSFAWQDHKLLSLGSNFLAFRSNYTDWNQENEILVSTHSCPVAWSCRIHRLRLSRGVMPTPNNSPTYDTKKSDGEVPVMLELWGVRSIPSLPSLPGPLWAEMVALDRALSMGQIKLNCILMLNWIVCIRTVWLNRIAYNRNVFDN